ncbi:MAG: hypothetical protein JJT95_07235 [Pararhodobacter sp.]|nr:hypothetical protein [Pararhodobacter sp.]
MFKLPDFFNIVPDPGSPHRLGKDKAPDHGVACVTDPGRVEADDQARMATRALDPGFEIMGEPADNLTKHPHLEREPRPVQTGDIFHDINQVVHVPAKGLDDMVARTFLCDTIRPGACQSPVNMIAWMPGVITGHGRRSDSDIARNMSEPPAKVIGHKTGQLGVIDLHHKAAAAVDTDRVPGEFRFAQGPGQVSGGWQSVFSSKHRKGFQQ